MIAKLPDLADSARDSLCASLSLLNVSNGALAVERPERFEQKFSSVSDVPDVTREEVTVGTRHRFS
jgi:hypothetical protein